MRSAATFAGNSLRQTWTPRSCPAPAPRAVTSCARSAGSMRTTRRCARGDDAAGQLWIVKASHNTFLSGIGYRSQSMKKNDSISIDVDAEQQALAQTYDDLPYDRHAF